MPKKKKKQVKKSAHKLDIDQILLHSRQVFMYGTIDTKKAEIVNKQLRALDKENKKPIGLWINSPGGSVIAGFSIIDTMNTICSEVATVIIGQAASMAGLVSVAGDKRLMTINSRWMSHDMSGGIWGDYATKVLDRAKVIKYEQKRIFNFLRANTKLSEAETTKARNGELWLYVDECLQKGIVDEILGGVSE